MALQESLRLSMEVADLQARLAVVAAREQRAMAEGESFRQQAAAEKVGALKPDLLTLTSPS
jgi:hypothetical protein